jgi:hypothetical protein
VRTDLNSAREGYDDDEASALLEQAVHIAWVLRPHDSTRDPEGGPHAFRRIDPDPPALRLIGR